MPVTTVFSSFSSIYSGSSQKPGRSDRTNTQSDILTSLSDFTNKESVVTNRLIFTCTTLISSETLFSSSVETNPVENSKTTNQFSSSQTASNGTDSFTNCIDCGYPDYISGFSLSNSPSRGEYTTNEPTEQASTTTLLVITTPFTTDYQKMSSFSAGHSRVMSSIETFTKETDFPNGTHTTTSFQRIKSTTVLDETSISTNAISYSQLAHSLSASGSPLVQSISKDGQLLGTQSNNSQSSSPTSSNSTISTKTLTKSTLSTFYTLDDPVSKSEEQPTIISATSSLSGAKLSNSRFSYSTPTASVFHGRADKSNSGMLVLLPFVLL